MQLKKINKKGFTLAELLIVILIIGILMGVSIPFAISARVDLEIHQLDSTARNIYTAAQNRMAVLSANGQLSESEGAVVDDLPGCNYITNETDDILITSLIVEPHIKNNYYLIVYNKSTATVLSVFYSEKYELNGEYLEIDNKKTRRDLRIGYYGGDDIELPDINFMPEPLIIISNSDELRAIFNIGETDIPYTSIRYDLYLSSTSGNENIHIGSDLFDSSGRASFTLDSLSADRFHTLAAGSGITPGSDIIVTVSVRHASDTSYSPSAASASSNSLFASRTDDEVIIVNKRHFQNLDTITALTDSSIKKAVQINDILNIGSFTPISNNNLESFIGGGHKIEGASVNTSGQAGLFTSTGAFLKDIHMVNPLIISSNSNAGAVAASFSGEMSGCFVYITDYDNVSNYYVTGGLDTGGLVGANTGTITGCAAALYSITGGGNATNVGGLAGTNNGIITESFANNYTIKSSSANVNAGGFAGYSSGNVENCYAISSVDAPASGISAGFIASTGSGSTVRSSYSMIYNNSYTQPVAYFAPVSNPGTFENCNYLQYNVNNPSNSVGQLKSYEEMYSLFGASPWSELSKNKTSAYSTELRGLAYPYSGLTGTGHFGDWPVPTTELFPVYYEVVMRQEVDESTGNFNTYYDYYYYARVGDSVYNTLGNSNATRYKDGYAVLSYNPLNTSTERTILYKKGAAGETATSSLIYDSSRSSLTVNGVRYNMYFLPDEVVQGSEYASATFTQNLSVYGKVLTYNPHFATTGNSTNTTAVVRTVRHLVNLAKYSQYQDNDYIQELDIDYNIYQGYDGSGFDLTQKTINNYTGSYSGSNKSIFTLTVPSSGAGSGLVGTLSGSIKNLNISVRPDTSVSGSVNSGVIAAINEGVIENCSVTVENFNISSSSAAGYFAGIQYDTGIISGSAVYINGTSTIRAQNTGGFIGTNNGEITDSKAVYRTGTGSVSINGTNTGGFVGLNNNSIKTSFVTTPDTISTATINGGANQNFAGFAGNNTGSAVISESGIITGNTGNLNITGENASGFIGVNDGRITFSYIRAADNIKSYNIRITATDSDGAGFVNTNRASIDNCYVVAIINSPQYSSGFAHLNSGTIVNSYSSCHTTGKFAAGFAQNNAGNISYSYSLFKVNGENHSYGFVYSNKNNGVDGVVSNCYSACSVIVDKNNRNNAYGFSGNDGTVINCYYLADGIDATRGRGTPVSYDALRTALSGGSWKQAGTYNGISYTFSSTEGYPFPMVGVHYGDWPLRYVQSYGLFYYEKYQNGSYGIYPVGINIDPSEDFNLNSTLLQDVITETGYGVYWTNSAYNEVKSYTLTGGTNVSIQTLYTSGTYKKLDIMPGYTFAVCTDNYGTGQKTLAINNNNFSVNTYFAKAVIKGITTLGTSANPFIVRTAQQLSNSRSYMGTANYYLQDLDIPSYSADPIGDASGQFNAKYNGNGYYIDNYTYNKTISNQNGYTGVFGYIGSSGEVKNLSIRGTINLNATITSGSSRSVYAGFIGYNAGKIENVYTYGTITTAGTGLSSSVKMTLYTGGLAGYNSGEIYYSGADTNLNVKTNSRCTTYTGGFTGYNNASTSSLKGLSLLASGSESLNNIINYSKIKYCYAIGKVTSTGCSDTEYIGGFAGSNASKAPMAYCYSKNKVISTSGSNNGQFIGYLNYNLAYCYAYNNGESNISKFGNYAGGLFSGYIYNYACFYMTTGSDSSSMYDRAIKNMNIEESYQHVRGWFSDSTVYKFNFTSAWTMKTSQLNGLPATLPQFISNPERGFGY